ncbi:MAG: metalloregulator ArsR/SmtB family transcription factor [Anaerococcus sp.]|nr:metalloregulator ArsR/SmtB family transcription factor [Anaerococcus sp.]
MEYKSIRLEEETLADLANLFKVFADNTRMRILYRLFDREESVGDIALNLDMSQSAISHQLSYLRETNLVKSRREGKNILYSLSDSHVKLIIKMGLEHIKEEV